MRLGETIAAGASQATFPALLEVIRPAADSSWQIRKDKTSFFHSHLILNSLYYLSHQNILRLDPGCEALYTEWVQKDLPSKKSARLIVIEYPERQKAEAALAGFLEAYLREKAEGTAESYGLEKEKVVQLEDGWLGWKLSDNYLALVFEAPDEKSVKELFNQLAIK